MRRGVDVFDPIKGRDIRPVGETIDSDEESSSCMETKIDCNFLKGTNKSGLNSDGLCMRAGTSCMRK